MVGSISLPSLFNRRCRRVQPTVCFSIPPSFGETTKLTPTLEGRSQSYRAPSPLPSPGQKTSVPAFRKSYTPGQTTGSLALLPCHPSQERLVPRRVFCVSLVYVHIRRRTNMWEGGQGGPGGHQTRLCQRKPLSRLKPPRKAGFPPESSALRYVAYTLFNAFPFFPFTLAFLLVCSSALYDTHTNKRRAPARSSVPPRATLTLVPEDHPLAFTLSCLSWLAGSGCFYSAGGAARVPTCIGASPTRTSTARERERV